jgi:hypothetical protein
MPPGPAGFFVQVNETRKNAIMPLATRSRAMLMRASFPLRVPLKTRPDAALRPYAGSTCAECIPRRMNTANLEAQGPMVNVKTTAWPGHQSFNNLTENPHAL